MTHSTVSPPMPLRIHRTIAAVRSDLSERRASSAVPITVGLVPTMGALHSGHLSLLKRAREQCDVVVVSLFVNPAQFNDAADLRAYPRSEDHDRRSAELAGADIVFAPSVEEMYPPDYSTKVVVSGVSEPLEGARRGRSHFEGVATVVTKLLNIVSPEIAYFGQKDAQQAAVVQRMVADLNFPVTIEVCPTVREPLGLALSSRNQRLSGSELARANALHHALELAGQLVAAGERDSARIVARARDQIDAAGVSLEYFELVNPDTFRTVQVIGAEPVLAVVAARVGDVRLIDNELLEP